MAVLSFFIPLVGLILYIIYENKQPRRAGSVGKGALIGFITKTVLSVLCVILYITCFTALFGSMTEVLVQNTPAGISSLRKETAEDVMEKYADVTFGEFTVQSNGYFDETSLEVTVKNKSQTQSTFYITIEAVDENGTRIETDTVFADRLNPGQEVCLKAFEYINPDKMEAFKSAEFKVLEAERFDY